MKLTEQDVSDLTGFALVGNILKDKTLLKGLHASIRNIGPTRVFAWLGTQDSRRKYHALISDACVRVVNEDNRRKVGWA